MCWANEIPITWSIAALKYVVTMKSGKQITAEDIKDGELYPVFGGNGLRGFTSSYTHEGHFALIGRQGALCGNINYASGQFWASEHAVIVHQRQSFAVRWMGELLRCMDLGQYSITAAQPGLSVEAIGNLRIPVPSFAEQSAIAAFLDRETGKIDVLVAEQERLIALLKEKRQAVISHAVTKGLNPNAPMKDSGVAWLGEMPAHWKVLKLSRLAKVGNGSTPNRDNQAYWLDGNYPWLNSSHVNRGTIDDSPDFVTDIALRECHLPIIVPPAVLVGITGQGRTRGMASLLTFEATVNQHVAFIRPRNSQISADYILNVSAQPG